MYHPRSILFVGIKENLFARYQVTGSANVYKGTEVSNQSITVNAPTETGTFGYKIDATIARSGSNSAKTALLLTTVEGGAAVAKVWDAGGELVSYTAGASETEYFEYTITLTGHWDTTGSGDASGLTSEAKHALLNNSKKYKITWSITGDDATRARLATAATFASEVNSSSSADARMLHQVNVSGFLTANSLPSGSGHPTTDETNAYTGEGQTQTVKLYVRADGAQDTAGVDGKDTDALSFTVSASASIA